MQEDRERTSEVISGILGDLLTLWSDLLGPANAEMTDLVRSGYGIEPIDFYQEALRLAQLRFAAVGYDVLG
jgi:hypothetical protein